MTWAHPRVCGENPGASISITSRTGSSPRVRGKPGALSTGIGAVRLIPACAGKTPTICVHHALFRAHPRVCGENYTVSAFLSNEVGSSPRVRGKRQQGRHRRPAPRLIPACAGKTATGNAYIKVERAHPRVCGENTIWAAPLVPKTGSSPRVRGKHFKQARYCRCHGLIPACAGKTPWRVDRVAG